MAVATEPVAPIRATSVLADHGVDHRRCQLALLEDLGWEIELAPTATLRSQGGNLHGHANLAAARAARDLVLHVPQATELWLADPQSGLELEAAIDDPASRAAFAMRIGDAIRTAVDKLVGNTQYRFKFRALKKAWVGFGAAKPADAGWRPIFNFGRGFIPIHSNTAAMNAFYSRAMRSECGTGRQVAQYAMLAELFGAAGFDRAFEREEIVVGLFKKLGESQSILLGSARGEMFADGLAVKTSALGRHAFSGVPGFLYHVLDPCTLDDIDNQAQNFVVYDVDSAAADALRRNGGFAYYNRINTQVWELSRRFQTRGLRWFERLLHGRNVRLRVRLTSSERELLSQMCQMMDDPFYSGFRVYGHAKGVKPIGFFVARMLDRNPRTPYRVELALHNLHTEIYRRYVRDRIDVRLMAQNPS